MKSRKLVFHADSIRDLTASQLASRFGGSGDAQCLPITEKTIATCDTTCQASCCRGPTTCPCTVPQGSGC